MAIAAWVALTFLVAGFVKGVVGMGMPTVAMGLLGLAMPTVEAAALLIVPSLVTNLWQAFGVDRLRAVGRRLASLLVGICIGTALGIGLMAGHRSGAAMKLALGGVLCLYAIVALVRPHWQPGGGQRWVAPLVGLATGVLSGATGIFVMPLVPYLGSLRLQRDQLIQAMGVAFSVCTLALAAGLFAYGRFRLPALAQSSLAVVPAVAGLALGQRLRGRLQAERFRRWFLRSLVALGLYMVVDALAVGHW